jgi:hypothetical protein
VKEMKRDPVYWLTFDRMWGTTRVLYIHLSPLGTCTKTKRFVTSFLVRASLMYAVRFEYLTLKRLQVPLLAIAIN